MATTQITPGAAGAPAPQPTPAPAPATPEQAQPTPSPQPAEAAPQTPQPPQPRSVFDLFDAPKKAQVAPAPEPPAPPEPAKEETAQTSAQLSGDEAEIAAIVAEFRERHPDAPEVVLQRLADKEAHIRKQSRQITELLARVTKKEEQPAAAPAGPPMTELERLATAPPVEQPQAQQTAVPTAAVQQPQIQQPAVPNPEQAPLPEYLRTPETAYAELSNALALGDFTHAHEVEEQMFGLRMQAVAPRIQEMIRTEAQRMIQENLGDVLPGMRERQAAEQNAMDREVALSELERSGEAQVREMFTPLSEGVIQIGDGKYTDTVANRIIAENPWILKIEVDHPDPRMAYRLTLINRYRAIGTIAKSRQGMSAQTAPAAPAAPAPAAPPASSGIAPEQAQALIAAGREEALREERDRIRQAMNGGRMPPAAGGEDQVARLTRRTGSWSDMFPS